MNNDLRGKKRSTLGYDRACVVMGHDMLWANHDIVACFDNFAIGETNRVLLDNFFNDSLGNSGSGYASSEEPCCLQAPPTGYAR